MQISTIIVNFMKMAILTEVIFVGSMISPAFAFTVQCAGETDSSFDGVLAVCDANSPIPNYRVPLSDFDPGKLNVCLIVSPRVGVAPRAVPSASIGDRGPNERCDTVTDRHPFKVRRGIGTTLEIVRSYELQRSGTPTPNPGNPGYLSWAPAPGEPDKCRHVPWITSGVPYVLIENEEGEMVTNIVYIAGVTESYLARFGIDLNFGDIFGTEKSLDGVKVAVDFYRMTGD